MGTDRFVFSSSQFDYCAADSDCAIDVNKGIFANGDYQLITVCERTHTSISVASWKAGFQHTSRQSGTIWFAFICKWKVKCNRSIGLQMPKMGFKDCDKHQHMQYGCHTIDKT